MGVLVTMHSPKSALLPGATPGAAVTPRLRRHFNAITASTPADDVVKGILTAYVQGMLRAAFVGSSLDFVSHDLLASATLALVKQCFRMPVHSGLGLGTRDVPAILEQAIQQVGGRWGCRRP